ncbi:L,D-transpeptidase family protein [Thiomicrorhabdus aquaedulcis]|uniref:L,D-transpeptidase family protein n=1 Tax=Thiomicrorhabdus aquaedulcis TaxID=2211106 RepID=UPI000FDA654F|nr:L,D-transpeptidase family protein [Thiomicrorhabdus aquaedulcis]
MQNNIAMSWQWADETEDMNQSSVVTTTEPPKEDHPIDDSIERKASLDQAIRTFQQRHHINEEGVLGLKTRAQLALSVPEIIASIRTNLERWRWFQHLPTELNQQYIEVNIANFSLRYIHDAQNFSMKAVVGTLQRQTPMMEASLNHLVFNPYWRIPKTILVQDILPKLKKDLNYLNQHNIKIFNLNDPQERQPLDPNSIDWKSMSAQGILKYRFRQDAGATNALGAIKFMFPNNQDIYIHDTPVRSTFARTTRLASSGCIRAEKPKELAFHILNRNQSPTTQALVKNYLQSNQQHVVWLKDPIPVYLTYQTVWADESGRIFSRPDVYKYDTKLLDLFRNQL